MVMITDLLKRLNVDFDPTVRANCFNAVELFWQDYPTPHFLGPEEFVAYIDRHFMQIPLDESSAIGDVTIVWSRSSLELPIGQIAVQDLVSKQPGYPFGLVIEHAFIDLNDGTVFQKPNPSPSSRYENVHREEALAPYRKLKGYEVTRHRRKLDVIE